jgi:hypothetical protein
MRTQIRGNTLQVLGPGLEFARAEEGTDKVGDAIGLIPNAKEVRHFAIGGHGTESADQVTAASCAGAMGTLQAEAQPLFRESLLAYQ